MDLLNYSKIRTMVFMAAARETVSFKSAHIENFTYVDFSINSSSAKNLVIRYE